jgi:hypothetical protein
MSFLRQSMFTPVAAGHPSRCARQRQLTGSTLATHIIQLLALLLRALSLALYKVKIRDMQFSAAHMDECIAQAEEREKAAERMGQSEGIECGICLEVVLEKRAINDRRFGVLGMRAAADEHSVAEGVEAWLHAPWFRVMQCVTGGERRCRKAVQHRFVPARFS